MFQAVQQPVCIVLAVRLAGCDPDAPARVRFRSLPVGTRENKFAAISVVTLDSGGWADCPSDWRAAFLPEATGEWDIFPALEDFFVYNGSGVMPGRTWVIAPDSESLAAALGATNQGKQSRREGDLISPTFAARETGR